MSGVALGPGARLGFHGKIPLASDFVTRRLPRVFVDAWDGWLQQCIQASRQQLGEDWLDAYLNSPVWRFALSGGTCGPEAFIGVLIPSVDKVGRYFPFALVLALPPSTNAVALLTTEAAWFERVEALALSVLEQDVDIERLEESLQDFAVPAAAQDAAPVAWSGAIRLGFAGEDGPAALLPALLDGAMTSLSRSYSLWWTLRCDGQPSLLVCRGLPSPGGFTALLDGDWAARGWTGQETAEPWAPDLAAPAGRDDD